jgi:ribosomal-protein-alanine N-acetyltransferase
MDAIRAIENECFSDPWSENIFMQELNDKHVIAYAALDTILVGYTFMRHIINEGHIQNIAVASAYRGKGISSLLMNALIAEAAAREMIGIMLEVRQGNRAAMALYHKFGFIIEGYRRNYYSDPNEDAVIMWKDILR